MPPRKGKSAQAYTTTSQAKSDWLDAKAYYREHFELVEKCKDFLFKQQHYQDDKGVTLEDATIAPKGAELNDQHRYKVSQILREGPYIECHPRDKTDDPYAAEYAKRVLLSIVEDGTNRYTKVRRRVASGGLAVGTWYAMVHWDPDRGPFGDLVFETLEPTCVMPCPGYLDVHDPLCPYVIIERHETVESIQAKAGKGDHEWKNTEELWPDNNGRYGTESDWTRAHAQPSPNEDYAPDTVTVLYTLYRKSSDTTPSDAGTIELPKDRQYMACPECGYRDDQHERMPDGELPEIGAACPMCLSKMMEGQGNTPSYLYRVTNENLTEHRLKYPKGKMVISAPYQDREFYNGPWQSPTRSYPLFQFRAYESPYELMGGTDTLIYWSLQALMDQIRKQAYDQLATSKPIIIFSGAHDGKGLVDAAGRPFLYTAENGQVAYADGPPGMLHQMVTQFAPSGMPGSLPAFYNIMQQSFFGTRGVGQVQFSPGESKDVAYKSLLLQKESGDVPVDDHKSIFREEEGMFLGCALDVWVHNSTEQRAIRYLGEDGNMEFQLLKGSDIPNVDVIVGTPPNIRQGAIDEIQALTQWMQVPSKAGRAIIARRLGLSPSEVSEVEAELSAAKPPPGEAGPGGPPPPGPPDMGEQGGMPTPDMLAALGGIPPQMGA